VFEQFNVILNYCFNYYKVLVEPRTVMELFKLITVIERLDLSNDNTRKCTVENRNEVSGTYKGLIYCQSLNEGKEVLEIARQVITEEISKDVPVSLKRGCSEYAVAYPEYAQTGQDKKAMTYREEWQEYEDLADKNLVVNTQVSASDTHNRPGFTGQDALIMFTWLKYAATIGDSSYLKISDGALKPFPNVIRPSPFHPVDVEK
jgi:hypothetical protein